MRALRKQPDELELDPGVPVVVGSRVFCVSNGQGWGVVYDIIGDQAPEHIRIFARVGVLGGKALFNIVWERGAVSLKVPEAVVRGPDWTVTKQVAGPAEIERLINAADESAREAVRKKHLRDLRVAADADRLRSDPAWAHLEQGCDPFSGNLAFENIKRALAKAFPGAEFAVRRKQPHIISVSWTDGPTGFSVEGLVSRFEASTFDDANLAFNLRASAWCEVFGGVQFVLARRSLSDGFLAKAIEIACKGWGRRPKPLEVRLGTVPWLDEARSADVVGEVLGVARLMIGGAG